MVLFSSIASLTGPAGSAAYAAANAILDSASHAFNAAGLQSSAVQWGAWSGIGMVSSSTAVQRAMERSGIGMVTCTSGLKTIAALLSSPHNSDILSAIPFKWETFMKNPRNSKLAIYGEFKKVRSTFAAERNENSSSLRTTTHAAAELPSFDEILVKVMQCVRSVHGDEVEAKLPLIQAGIDSLGTFFYYFVF